MTGTIISINATRTHIPDILADKKLWYMVSIRMMIMAMIKIDNNKVRWN